MADDVEKIPLLSKFPQLDQIGIVVKDMEFSFKFYEQMFGPPFLTFESDVNSGKLKFGLFQVGEIQLELIQVLEGETIHSKFLTERGEGLHHIGFIVENIEEELTRLEKEGIKVLERGIVQEMVKFAYLDTEENLGIILELIQLAL
ncbi:MAG: VOC family protein [Candidatus Heimdallarchaeota archaeon]|nr:MAG: VOC family protein [Candidatus Heimdallarchaeota archaeon]